MASYNRIKAARAVPIGTIMPWTGAATNSVLAEDAIPPGYIVCRGQTVRALDYPLLANLIGNTYGPYQEPGGPAVGIQNDFPNYTDTDLFVLPNLNNLSMVDIEASRVDPTDQLVIGQYITENGFDAEPLSNVVSYIDAQFQIEPDSQLSGKITGITLQEPTYFQTFRTIPRKLGVDHTPAHTHPRPPEGDNYPSADVSGRYVALFQAGNFQPLDSEWTTGDSVDSIDDDLPADRFSPGEVQVTWYDPVQGQSLPTMDQFHDMTGQSSVLPAIRVGQNRNISAFGNTQSYTDDYSCVSTQTVPAVTGLFPPPGTYNGGLNYYPGPNVAADRSAGTYPSTLNHNYDAWVSTSFASHNHFTIDVNMTIGQMRIPNTILINNMTTGTIAPVSVDRALSVQINPNTPSLTTLVVMRAF